MPTTVGLLTDGCPYKIAFNIYTQKKGLRQDVPYMMAGKTVLIIIHNYKFHYIFVLKYFNTSHAIVFAKLLQKIYISKVVVYTLIEMLTWC